MATWSSRFDARRQGAGPLVIAHRGASVEALENTMSAFAAAERAGADGIELDVRRCASGELVVFHDADLRRLAERPERVAATPWAALAALCLRGGERIPLLREVLQAFPSLLVNIEIKAPGRGREPGVAARTVAEVRALRAEERVLVSSFDPVVLACVRLRAPHLATGLLFESSQALPLRRGWLSRLLLPTAVHPEHVLVTPARMARWRRRGLAVTTWTVDSPDRWRVLRELGVDAIVTNDPARLRAALAGAGQAGAW